MITPDARKAQRAIAHSQSCTKLQPAMRGEAIGSLFPQMRTREFNDPVLERQ
jgi:hypothetical protein